MFARIVLILLSFLLGASVRAGFDDGMDAARHGDYVSAFAKFSEAAKQGDARAQTAFGDMYRYGLGVERNDAEAVYWYRKAAGLGFAMAQ